MSTNFGEACRHCNDLNGGMQYPCYPGFRVRIPGLLSQDSRAVKLQIPLKSGEEARIEEKP
jgi:hypothetical protein